MIAPVPIADVLSSAEVADTLAQLSLMTWRDGKKTAGAVAASVKTNLQVDDEQSRSLRHTITSKLAANALITAIARPSLTAIMFSRYDTGAEYGLHVDSPVMSRPAVRRDISFTLFLSDPASYGGGDLVIETPFDEQRFKLAAGSIVIYPATALHRVTRIEHGSRTVVVGWIRSQIRDAAKRELLFELDAVKSSLFERDGKSNEVDVLSKCSANLMRMWMDD